MEQEPGLIECAIMLPVVFGAWLLMFVIWFAIFLTCQDLNAFAKKKMYARMQSSKAKRELKNARA